MWAVIQDDGISEGLRKIEDNQFDSIVTDPPYDLGFMGKKWDSHGGPKGFQDWCYEWAVEAYRVLKPGAYMLAFGGTRTYHRLVCALEDAGFEIRDSLHWIYGSGFPKSRDISKAIDSETGAEREIIGTRAGKSGENLNTLVRNGNDADDARGMGAYGIGAKQITVDIPVTVPATDDAKQWEGWGTALKPAHEPIVVARKPFKGTVATNVLHYGTGAINVDGCRVNLNGDYKSKPNGRPSLTGLGDNYDPNKANQPDTQGRWPPNVILTHSPDCVQATETLPDGGVISRNECADDCPVAEMDRQSGKSKSTSQPRHNTATGGASRFFPCYRYNAKAPKKERAWIWAASCKCDIDDTDWTKNSVCPNCGKESKKLSHPTVKPLALMRWLVRLVTPPGGVVADFFAGSGATAEACELEGFKSVMMENDPYSIRLLEKRMEKYETKTKEA